MIFALNSLLVTFRYNDMGTIVIGKVESGGAKKGETLLIMPNKVGTGWHAIYLIYLLHFIIYQVEVKVEQLWSDDMDVTAVTSGENVKIKVTFPKDQNWIRPLNIKCFR